MLSPFSRVRFNRIPQSVRLFAPTDPLFGCSVQIDSQYWSGIPCDWEKFLRSCYYDIIEWLPDVLVRVADWLALTTQTSQRASLNGRRLFFWESNIQFRSHSYLQRGIKILVSFADFAIGRPNGRLPRCRVNYRTIRTWDLPFNSSSSTAFTRIVTDNRSSSARATMRAAVKATLLPTQIRKCPWSATGKWPVA